MNVERHIMSREITQGEHTTPWRKARICARFVLHPELIQRSRYARIAAALARDPSVTNRLIAQAIAHLKGKRHQRTLAS